MQPHRQQQLEIEGNDICSQAKDWQQGSVHAAQPDKGLVLYHLNHYLKQQAIVKANTAIGTCNSKSQAFVQMMSAGQNLAAGEHTYGLTRSWPVTF